jgi:hypothetical protein
LREAGRFEPLHFPLPPSHDLVRVLGAIVHPQPLLNAGRSGARLGTRRHRTPSHVSTHAETAARHPRWERMQECRTPVVCRGAQ